MNQPIDTAHDGPLRHAHGLARSTQLHASQHQHHADAGPRPPSGRCGRRTGTRTPVPAPGCPGWQWRYMLHSRVATVAAMGIATVNGTDIIVTCDLLYPLDCMDAAAQARPAAGASHRAITYRRRARQTDAVRAAMVSTSLVAGRVAGRCPMRVSLGGSPRACSYEASAPLSESRSGGDAHRGQGVDRRHGRRGRCFGGGGGKGRSQQTKAVVHGLPWPDGNSPG